MGAAVLAFLSAIASKVVIAVLGMIVGWVAKQFHYAQQDKKIADDSKEAHKALDNAKTGDEIDKSSDAALGGF